MQESSLTLKQIIVSDIEIQISPAMVNLFLTPFQVQSFSKSKDKIYITFKTQAAAKAFIQEHNHRTQMLRRKFNIYYSFFDTSQQGVRLEANGIEESKLRSAFEICDQYGPCRFKLDYQNNSLNYNCHIDFLKFDLTSDLPTLKASLANLDIKIRHEEAFGNINEFRCSIQLDNFTHIKDVALSPMEQVQMKKELENVVVKATGERPSFIQLHTYVHALMQPRIKAYFQFQTTEETFANFEKLRKFLLDGGEEMTCKLFYFQHESNSYYTLFASGLLNKKELPDKQFDDELLQVFRKVNPNITQITTKKKYSSYTAKIYFKTQDSGKDFIVESSNARSVFYEFLKPNTPLSVNIFMSNAQQKVQNKIENNTNRLIKQINQTNHQQVQGIAPLREPPYPKRNRQEQREGGNREKRKKYQ